MKSNLLVLCLILISFSTAILNTHVESGTRTRFTNVVFYDGDVKIHGKPLIRSNVNVFISLSSLLLYQGREEDFNEDDLNSRSFIIKRYELSSIDLSCGGFMFICSLKELKSEFEKSYKSINFQFHSDGIPMASDKIESNCLVLTFGVLEDINEQPIICFRELKDLVNVQNFISDLYSLNANYKGPVSLVSPGGDFLIPGELTLDTKKLTFSFFKSSKEKKGGEFSLRDIEGYVSSSDGNFWNGNESDKPENCFTMKILNKQTIWCIVYYNTHLYPSKLNPRKFPTWSGQFYKYNWIARINNCIHLLNLNKSQKILLSHYKENSIISCSATILGAVLYEIRHKVDELNLVFHSKAQDKPAHSH